MWGRGPALQGREGQRLPVLVAAQFVQQGQRRGPQVGCLRRSAAHHHRGEEVRALVSPHLEQQVREQVPALVAAVQNALQGLQRRQRVGSHQHKRAAQRKRQGHVHLHLPRQLQPLALVSLLGPLQVLLLVLVLDPLLVLRMVLLVLLLPAPLLVQLLVPLLVLLMVLLVASLPVPLPVPLLAPLRGPLLGPLPLPLLALLLPPPRRRRRCRCLWVGSGAATHCLAATWTSSQ